MFVRLAKTVYDRTFGDVLAKISVQLLYKCVSGQPYIFGDSHAKLPYTGVPIWFWPTLLVAIVRINM